MQTMDAIQQAAFSRRREVAGSGPPFAAISRFHYSSRTDQGVSPSGLWEVTMVLKTPPCTDAVKCDFHRSVRTLGIN